MEPRHELQVEALRLFFEANDIKILHERRSKEALTFVTDAQGFTHKQLRNLTNFAHIGIFLCVINRRYTMGVNVHFV